VAVFLSRLTEHKFGVKVVNEVCLFVSLFFVKFVEFVGEVWCLQFILFINNLHSPLPLPFGSQ